jgi:hypothetical protein
MQVGAATAAATGTAEMASTEEGAVEAGVEAVLETVVSTVAAAGGEDGGAEATGDAEATTGDAGSPQPAKKWADLSDAERGAAATLGYSAQAWDDELVPPACALSAWDADPEAIRSWDELTEELRAAAIVIGYTWDAWDEEMLPEGRPMDNHPQTSMFQKDEAALAFDERQGANFACKVLARRWKKGGGGGSGGGGGGADGTAQLAQWEYRVHYLGWKSKWDQWLTNEHVFKKVEHNMELLQNEMGDRPLTKKEKKALALAEKAKKQEEREAKRHEREAQRAAEKAAQQAAREAQRLARKRERESTAATKKAEAETAKRKRIVPPEREGYGVAWSDEHGHWFWWNKETHESRWTDPDPEENKPPAHTAAGSKKKKQKKRHSTGAAEGQTEKEQQQEEKEEEEEDWLTTGHRWIGLKGMRHFDDGSVFGEIVSWLPARASTTPEPDDLALWRFQHADGDQEDLEEHEVRQSVSELREHEAREAAPQRSAEENWEAFVKLRDSLRAKAADEGGWQCKKGDKLLCFDRNKSTASSVEIANCYEAVVLRVRPASAIKATTSPPSGEDASLTAAPSAEVTGASGDTSHGATKPAAVTDGTTEGDSNHASAASQTAGGAASASPSSAAASVSAAAASAPADATAAASGSNGEKGTTLHSHADATAGDPDEARFYLHFLGYSKGQDRWECESNFVPLTDEARALKETMHNQWDVRKSAGGSAATLCRLPGDPENVQLVRGAVRYGATVPDVVPESLNGILPAAPVAAAAAGGASAAAVAADAGSASAAAPGCAPVETASTHLRQFGCTTLDSGLSEDDVSACATVIETWFNHVVVKLNTLGLQEVMKNVGFTEFKTRGPGRYDLNPPALKNDDAFAFFRSDEAPWVSVCRSILGDDMRCIAMGCMLSMPGE